MTELTDENAGISRRTLLVAAVFTSVGLAAGCVSRSGGDAGGDPGRGSASEGAAGASGSAGSQEAPAPQAAIQVTIDGTSYSARLNGTQAAESLKPLLPLTLSFRDFSSGFDEKIADLDQPLAFDQMPAGDDPAPGDIAYWSPDQRIVLYWGDVARYDGIHLIGSFDSDDAIEAIRSLTPSSSVTISASGAPSS